MSTLKLNGATSGSSIIKAPDSGSTGQTFTLPASTGTLLTSTVRTATNEEDAILIEQSDGGDIGSLRINNGSFIIKGKHTSNPVQIQTHDGNEDIEVDPDGFIKFETGGSERMRLTDNGLTFNGDTAATNALDDYETGTFTLTFGGSSGNPTVSYNSTQHQARYTKIGNVVSVFVSTRTDSLSGGSGFVELQGLPFATGGTQNQNSGSVGYVQNFASTFSPHVWAVSTHIRMYKDANNSTIVNISDCATGNDSNQLRFTLTYTTD